MTHMGPQFTQLAMLHQAKDFVGDQKTTASTKIYPGAADFYEGGPKVMWEAKRREISDRRFSGSPDNETLKQSISREGIKNPARVLHGDPSYNSGTDKPYLFDAHHRVLAEHDLRGPNAEVPTIHSDPFNSPYNTQGMGNTGVTSNPKMMQGFTPPKRPR